MLAPSALERYIDAASPVHALDARVKLLLALAAILALGLLPPDAWPGALVIAALIWLAVLKARVGLATILRRAFVALPFALAALTLVFSRPGEPLLQIALGPVVLRATDGGLLAFAAVVVKSWLSVQAALLLTATTHFTDLLHALRALRLPAVLVATLSFAYRYLFVLVDEAQRLVRARACRSAALPDRHAGGSIAWRAGVVGRMVGTLFLRSYERSERIYVAMLARGFSGELRAVTPRSLSSVEQGLLLLGASALAAIVLLSYTL
jgi:cobalt/nickel transport system permease protein